MTAMNTIRVIENLTRTGFTEEQARAVVGAVSDVVEDSTATRLDFVEMKAGLHNEIADVSRQLGALEARLDARLDTRLATLDARLDTGLATLDAKLDTGLATLGASIANAKLQMVLYTGALVAAIAAVSKLFN